jgi:TetR/AcrR family transcriptional regulator, regulator of cefoperazone and chloramphenicol sensitivity
MRIAPLLDSDLTAKARIRDAAMEMFGTQGVAASSLRAVAGAASVSPGLIVHHFGSKEGLIRAVDEAVLARINLTLSEVPIEGLGTELIARRAVVVAALLRSQPALCDYLGRALAERTKKVFQNEGLCFLIWNLSAVSSRIGGYGGAVTV